MLLEKERVLSLYRDQELSAKEVAIKCGVRMGAVYRALEKFEIPKRTSWESNRIRFNGQPASFVPRHIASSSEKDLKIAGLMLYWGEGTKAGDGLDFANSDTAMIGIFMKFLREVCGVNESRLRGNLYMYADQSEKLLLNHWSEVMRLPLSQFTRPHVRPDFRTEGRKMEWGLIHVRYCDKKLLAWVINELKILQEHMGGSYSGNYTTL